MKQYVNTPRRRFMAFLLAVTILIQCGAFTPFPARAATSAQASGKLTLGGEVVDYTQHLQDNGDGTYTLTLSLASAYSATATNKNSSISYNAYYTAPANGEYLVQLWGGQGGDGGNGEGGDAGYVYGIVYLKRGQTLYYQLGGNGRTTSSSGIGGGINGPGGHAGPDAIGPVGGGGGYSAVYLFDVGEFESQYLDADGNMITSDISESDRVSRHLMIAGGGGGGGNASARSLLIFSDDGNPADGGAGGSFNSLLTGTTLDGGTYFAGADGSSSGSNTNYAGRGGAIDPGESRASLLTDWGWTNNTGMQPNDWQASVNSAVPGGMGGDSDFRGGGGGAGYAGGSGGLQTESFVHTNVGGGGGGSSYLSGLVTRLTASQETLYQNQLDKGNDSATGGCIRITAINADATTELDEVNIAFELSQYFTLVNELTGWNVESGSLSAEALDLTGDGQQFQLVLKPKSGFAGGNGVPLLNTAITLSTDSATASMALQPSCAKVNVPLNFSLGTRNHTTNTTDHTLAVTELYSVPVLAGDWKYDFIEKISDYRVTDLDGNSVGTTVAPDRTTRYIVSCDVTPKSGAAVVGEVVRVTTVTEYVTVTVLSPGQDKLGGNAILYEKSLIYNEDNTYSLNLSVDVESKMFKAAQLPPSEIKTETGSFTASVSGYYYIQAWGGDGGKGADAGSKIGGSGGFGAYLEGCVYLEKGTTLNIVVGGAGASQDKINSGAGTGGGGGGYTKVSVEGSEVVLLVAGGGGGGGGAYSGWFSQRDGLGREQSKQKYETIANEGFKFFGHIMGDLNNRFPAEDAFSLVQNTLLTSLSGVSDYDATFAGGKGTNGNSSPKVGNNAAPGIAGQSYIYKTLVKDVSELSDKLSDDAKTAVAGYDYKNHGDRDPVWESVTNSDGEVEQKLTNRNDSSMGGAVRISCIQVEETTSGSIPQNYTFVAGIARYWDVVDCTVTNQNVTDKGQASKTEIKTSFAGYADCTQITLSNINPNYTTVPEGDADVHKTSFVITIIVKPKAEFAGGNDVPILAQDTSGQAMALATGMQLRQTLEGEEDFVNINVAGQDATDKANVPINVTLNPGDLIASDASKRTIDLDNPTSGIAPSNLYVWNQPTYQFDGMGTPKTLATLISEKDWRFEFVMIEKSVVKSGTTTELINETQILPNPMVSTDYVVTISVVPRKANPVAVQRPATDVTAVSISKVVEIIVVPRIWYVDYDNSNLEVDHTLDKTTDSLDPSKTNSYCTDIVQGQDHVITLTPKDGYRLPDTVTVTSFYGEEVPVSYNPSTGQVVIPAAYLVGTVKLEAAAEIQKYSVTIWYQTVLDGAYTKLSSVQYVRGADITSEFSKLGSMATPPTGYTFVWDMSGYGSDQATWPTEMPAANLNIYGSVVPNEHTITVVCKSGDEVLHTETIDSYYGATVTVTAPVISGYVVKGTQSYTFDALAKNETVEFQYEHNKGTLAVNYSYSNGKQPDSVVTKDIEADTPDEITIPSVTGYDMEVTFTADNVQWDAATNKLSYTPDSDASGITVNVVYTPKTYCVVLDAGEGNVAYTKIYVEYDNTLSYYSLTADGAKSFRTLPTPVLSGSKFLYWDLNDAVVTGETKVDFTDTVTITANWQQIPGAVIIRLVDDVGNVLQETDLNEDKTNLVGTELTYTAQKQITYNSTIYSRESVETLTFTVTAQNQVYYITYYSPRIVSIYYYDTDGSLVDWEGVNPNPVILHRNVGETYSVNTPDHPEEDDGRNFAVSHETVAGTVGTSHIAIKVYFTELTPDNVVSVTVNWGNLEYQYIPGQWDPQKHEYEEPTVEPQVTGGNYVTVTSGAESNVPVTVQVSYESAPGFTALTPQFTLTSAKPSTSAPDSLIAGLMPTEHQTFYLWLTGTLPDNLAGQTITTGTVTVTISDPTGG